VARLIGKVALITGGGGGIGRATAERFAEEGGKVIVADINDALGEAAAASAKASAKHGGDATYVHCDVTDKASVAAAVSLAVKQFGRLDVLHNNAGGATPADGRVTEVSEDEFWRAIKLDLFGTFLCSKFAIPEIARTGGGSVINMSSIVAIMAMPGRDCYTAAKGGISALTRSMAVEYAPDRIRVNAIAPSVTLSDRVKKQLEGNPVTEELGRQHLLGLIEPVYIANLAVYLASDESARTTGQIMPVDSGVTIK
jgi:NAD(P)-dependent dehydrogenase (short-subunit alcohol dehydrogenase family)